MKKIVILIISIIVLFGIYLFNKSENENTNKEEKKIIKKENKIDNVINNMTLEEKIYQLFMVQIKSSSWTNYNKARVGGIIIAKDSSYENLDIIGKDYKIKPFIATDDEGGVIERAAVGYKSARDYNGDTNLIYEDEVSKSKVLLSKGINLDLMPVSDTIKNPNSPLYKRSYSSDPEIVKKSIEAVIKARKSTKVSNKMVGSVIKHYPGYPEISINTDYGEATDNENMENINNRMDVFKYGIEKGADAVMVSNVVYTNYDCNNPASLSNKIIGDLRNNFDGVIMTDDIGVAKGVSNINGRYKKAIASGNDMILIWDVNLKDAYTEVNDAVINKEITEEKINESLVRILKLKYKLNIMKY